MLRYDGLKSTPNDEKEKEYETINFHEKEPDADSDELTCIIPSALPPVSVPPSSSMQTISSSSPVESAASPEASNKKSFAKGMLNVGGTGLFLYLTIASYRAATPSSFFSFDNIAMCIATGYFVTRAMDQINEGVKNFRQFKQEGGFGNCCSGLFHQQKVPSEKTPITFAQPRRAPGIV